MDVLLTRCRISMCQGLGQKKHDEISEIVFSSYFEPGASATTGSRMGVAGRRGRRQGVSRARTFTSFCFAGEVLFVVLPFCDSGVFASQVFFERASIREFGEPGLLMFLCAILAEVMRKFCGSFAEIVTFHSTITNKCYGDLRRRRVRAKIMDRQAHAYHGSTDDMMFVSS